MATNTAGVLVIHDDPETLTWLVAALGSVCAHVAVARSLRAAAGERSQPPPEVVLLAGRPLDGDEDAARARLLCEELHASLVLLAGGTPERLDALQRASRAVAVLTPPVDPVTLRLVIGALTGGLDDPTVLEKMVSQVFSEGDATVDPVTYRCSVCRWLLYVGRSDYVQGAIAGQRMGGAIRCPGCGYASSFPPTRSHGTGDGSNEKAIPDV